MNKKELFERGKHQWKKLLAGKPTKQFYIFPSCLLPGYGCETVSRGVHTIKSHTDSLVRYRLPCIWSKYFWPVSSFRLRQNSAELSFMRHRRKLFFFYSDWLPSTKSSNFVVSCSVQTPHFNYALLIYNALWRCTNEATLMKPNPRWLNANASSCRVFVDGCFLMSYAPLHCSNPRQVFITKKSRNEGFWWRPLRWAHLQSRLKVGRCYSAFTIGSP